MSRALERAAGVLAVALLATGQLARAGNEDPGKGGFHLAVGSFKPFTDEKLSGRSGNESFALGFAWRQSRHFVWEIEYLGYRQESDIPAALKPTPALFTSWSGHASLTTQGFGGVAKLIQPLGPFDFYAGGGVGSYQSKLKVSGLKLTSPFTAKSVDVSKSDNSYGSQIVAGIDLHVARTQRLGLEYRRVVINPNFGSEIGATTAGGRMWQLTYRAFFGSCQC
jgi:opacity protein-like surface antigen